MLPYNIEQIVLSHSARSTRKNCDRKFEFRYMFGEAPTRDNDYAADCGKALHAGYQSYLKHQDVSKAVWDFMITFPVETEFARPNQAQRSMEACYSTLQAMIHSKFNNQYELVQILVDGKPQFAIEVPFAIEITGAPFEKPIWYVGFIDAILYDRYSDTYIVVDIKTTRQYLSDYSARYEFDEQCVPYGIVLENLLGKKIEQFDVAYLSAYIDLLEPVVNMYTYTKTRDHLVDWHRGLCEDVSSIIKHVQRGWFPRATNGEACISFNRKCQHTDYCSYRNIEALKHLLEGTPRKTLFEDKNVKPWATLELPFLMECM